MDHAPGSARTTDPSLLERVRDWRDDQAWTRFVAQYEPRLRGLCAAHGLVGAQADDCCQYVWLKLASAIRRFHYDPGRRFQHWLLAFFKCRILDMLRSSRIPWTERPLDDEIASGPDHPGDHGDACGPELADMLRRAEAIQDAVRARVAPASWEVFRLVAIDGRSVSEVARSLGREYTTVYRSYTRVSRMIDDERRRRGFS